MKSVTAVTVYAFHAVLPFLVSSAVSPCSIPPQSKLEECKLVRLGVCENPLSPLHLNFIHRRTHLQEHESFSSNYNCRHGTRVLQISSTHPSSPTYLGLGCGGSNLSREAHTSLPQSPPLAKPGEHLGISVCAILITAINPEHGVKSKLNL